MSLESVTNIGDLVATNPTSLDPKSQGDDHVRNIKKALLNDFAGFPGAVLVTGIDGGAADAYTLTPANPVVAYTTKMLILFVPTATSLTIAPTINISGLGAKPLKDVAGNAPLIGDFVSGRPYLGEYDGTNVRMMAITKNYADQLSFASSLPAQPGDALRYNLQSIGGVASWSLGGMDRRAITSADTVGVADANNLIEITSGTFTLAFAAAATLGDQNNGFIYNSGTGDVTLDPSGAETIDGLASFVMYPGEIRRWYVEGAALRTLKLKSFAFSRTTTFTYIHPPGYAGVVPDLLGAGGGGGSGTRGAAGSTRIGGTGGGGGARPPAPEIRDIAPGTSVLVTIGGAGLGGAARTADNLAGLAGTNGGNTSFGSHHIAYGGGAGANFNGNCTGGSGGGADSAGASGSPVAIPGGNPITPVTGNTTVGTEYAIGLGGAANSTSIGSASAEHGGASGGSLNASGTTGSSGGGSLRGGAGGGAGGGITAANADAAGGVGGTKKWGQAGGGAGGASGGAAGTAGTDGSHGSGSGGGGGGSNAAGAGGAGGVGGAGAGGGGGGASVNGSNSGAGGAGGSGVAWLKGI